MSWSRHTFRVTKPHFSEFPRWLGDIPLSQRLGRSYSIPRLHDPGMLSLLVGKGSTFVKSSQIHHSISKWFFESCITGFFSEKENSFLNSASWLKRKKCSFWRASCEFLCPWGLTGNLTRVSWCLNYRSFVLLMDSQHKVLADSSIICKPFHCSFVFPSFISFQQVRYSDTWWYGRRQ